MPKIPEPSESPPARDYFEELHEENERRERKADDEYDRMPVTREDCRDAVACAESLFSFVCDLTREYGRNVLNDPVPGGDWPPEEIR